MISYFFLDKDKVTAADMAAMSHLLGQLVSQSVSVDKVLLTTVLQQARIIVARNEEDEIVGMASLYPQTLLARSIGRIEEVVVDQTMRGRGIGKELTRRLVEEARLLGLSRLFLTSNPARVEANKLYQSFGFQRYETNTYKMDL